MRVYEIEFNEYFEVDKYDYVLAEDFDKAYARAKILLKERQRKTEDCEIVSISEEYEITEVKETKA